MDCSLCQAPCNRGLSMVVRSCHCCCTVNQCLVCSTYASLSCSCSHSHPPKPVTPTHVSLAGCHTDRSGVNRQPLHPPGMDTYAARPGRPRQAAHPPHRRCGTGVTCCPPPDVQQEGCGPQEHCRAMRLLAADSHSVCMDSLSPCTESSSVHVSIPPAALTCPPTHPPSLPPVVSLSLIPLVAPCPDAPLLPCCCQM